MNDLTTTAIASTTTTSTISDICAIAGDAIYNSYKPIYYDPYTYTISTMWPPAKSGLETDSNELKINIKKFQIKFNFNL